MADLTAPANAAVDLGPLYAMVGTVVVTQVAAGVVGIVKWLGSRTVEREDKDKQDLKAELKAHDAKFALVEQALREEVKNISDSAEDRFGELEKSIRDMDRTVLTVQNEVKSISGAVESIRSSVAGLQATIESRFDKQGDAYKTQMKEMLVEVTEKLEKVEYDLRQDTTRAITDAKMQLAVKRKR